MPTRQEVGVAVFTAVFIVGALCTAALLGIVYAAQLGAEKALRWLWYRKVKP